MPLCLTVHHAAPGAALTPCHVEAGGGAGTQSERVTESPDTRRLYILVLVG